jgi:glycine betaine/choline ABC-type transport system substrate-binding protein
MRTMNYAVDVEHKQVRDVARDFLEKAGMSQR